MVCDHHNVLVTSRRHFQCQVVMQTNSNSALGTVFTGEAR